jgi:hypothetical protein
MTKVMFLLGSNFVCQALFEKLNSFGIKSSILPTKYDGLGRLVITRKSDAIRLREFFYPKIMQFIWKENNLSSLMFVIKKEVRDEQKSNVSPALA